MDSCAAGLSVCDTPRQPAQFAEWRRVLSLSSALGHQDRTPGAWAGTSRPRSDLHSLLWVAAASMACQNAISAAPSSGGPLAPRHDPTTQSTDRSIQVGAAS